jgi:hypothetical protein
MVQERNLAMQVDLLLTFLVLRGELTASCCSCACQLQG